MIMSIPMASQSQTTLCICLKYHKGVLNAVKPGIQSFVRFILRQKHGIFVLTFARQLGTLKHIFIQILMSVLRGSYEGIENFRRHYNHVHRHRYFDITIRILPGLG